MTVASIDQSAIQPQNLLGCEHTSSWKNILTVISVSTAIAPSTYTYSLQSIQQDHFCQNTVRECSNLNVEVDDRAEVGTAEKKKNSLLRGNNSWKSTAHHRLMIHNNLSMSQSVDVLQEEISGVHSQ